MRAQLVRDPVLCHAQRLSDHAPVAFRFSRRTRLSADQLPIARYVLEHPRFAIVLQRFVDASCLDDYTVPLRLLRYKFLIKEAAR
eukprot:3194690-Heterocapsa_arctica.AAC.1